jgi:hypothetical protein
MDLDEVFGTQIVKKIRQGMEAREIPPIHPEEENESWFLPLILGAIESTVPKNFLGLMASVLTSATDAGDILAYLLLDERRHPHARGASPDIDFELSVFLDSVFWEKLIQNSVDSVAPLAQAFKLGSQSWVRVYLDVGLVLIYVSVLGAIAVVLPTDQSEDAIVQTQQLIEARMVGH